MLNFDKLMTLVENSTAMNEQYEDAYPEMSMLEAAAYLPAMITESQLELAESVNEQTERVMDIMTESADPKGDMEALTEASLQGIKERILGFLKKVKEVVMSIINKIGQAFTEMNMSNKDLISKYGADIQEAKCKNLTIHAFPAKIDVFKPHMDAANFMSVFAPKEVPADTPRQQQFVNEYKDAEKSKVQQEMVQALTGVEFKGDDNKNWGSAYLSKILGKKTDVKYGDGIFTKKDVFAIMKDTKILNDCKDQYDKILKDAARKEREIQKIGADVHDDMEGSGSGENGKGASAASIAYQCYTLWLTRYQMAYNCVSQAKNIEIKAIQAMQQQAKTMFAKMLKASTGKGSEK